MSLWERLRGLLAYEPALVAWAINGGIAAVAGYVAHLSPTQTGAVTTITTALAAVYSAARARPVSVSALTGGVATVITAATAFGLHASADTTALIVTALSGVLGLLLRANVTPAASRFATGDVVASTGYGDPDSA